MLPTWVRISIALNWIPELIGSSKRLMWATHRQNLCVVTTWLGKKARLSKPSIKTLNLPEPGPLDTLLAGN